MKKILYAVAAVALLSIASASGRTSSNKTEVAQNLSIFNAIVKELQINYVDSINPEKSVRDAIDAMLGNIDPYTEYFSAAEQEDFTSIASGEFGGIGCRIMQRGDKVVLSEPQWDSPARRDGVRHGDVIVAIDGDTVPSGFTSSQASSKLRGQAGTKVRVTVKRPYVTDSIVDLEITRGTIRNNPVPYYGMIGDGIGYIQLTTFNEHSARLVKDALLSLKKNPDFRYLVLDLRDNGGGLLESAVQIASLFVPKGTEIVRTRYRDKDNEKIYKTTQQPVDPTVPLAVLVNGGTASASEILSGSLQDLDRAVIIGNRSFGKGLVQQSRPLPYDGTLKITVARYYIPSGRLIQAIDYSHRNPDGTVARIPDSLTNVFHTAAGREVRDGGGITPDVKVTYPETNRLIYNVVADLWAYDYANRFAARQGSDMPSAADFEVTDSIFDDFKAFIDPSKFEYDRLCESGLKMMREAAVNEGYMNDSVAVEFDRLEALLKHDLNKDLDFNSKTLREILDTEISSRYYSEGDQAMRALRHDPEITEVRRIFTTPGLYKELLTPASTSAKK